MSQELEEKFSAAMASIKVAVAEADSLAEQYRRESTTGSPSAWTTFAKLMDAADEVEKLRSEHGIRPTESGGNNQQDLTETARAVLEHYETTNGAM